jgi:hypothetical protein
LVLGAPGAASADEPARAPAELGQVEGPMRPEAQALYDRGLGRFQSHDFAGATADFEAGYAIEPRREFLFAEGQARRLAGDCKGAVALYQRFLTTDPPPVQVNATHIALGRCAQHLAEHPDVVVVAPPQPLPPPPPRPPRWWLDPWALGTSAAGVVGLGVGVGFLLASNMARDEAGAAGSLAEFDRDWSTAESRRNVAVVAIVVGTSLVAVGVARFVLVRRQASRREAIFPIALGSGGVAFGGSF